LTQQTEKKRKGGKRKAPGLAGVKGNRQRLSHTIFREKRGVAPMQRSARLGRRQKYPEVPNPLLGRKVDVLWAEKHRRIPRWGLGKKGGDAVDIGGLKAQGMDMVRFEGKERTRKVSVTLLRPLTRKVERGVA